MHPSVGRIVHYRLDEKESESINRARANMLAAIREMPEERRFPIGDEMSTGHVVPMIVVRVANEMIIDGQCFIGAMGLLYVHGAAEGDGPGQWFWPPRVE